MVAIPDPVMVQRAYAFVVAAGDEQRPCRSWSWSFKDRGLAVQEVPERLEAVDELPKNSTGKVQKFKLREQIATTLADEAAAA